MNYAEQSLKKHLEWKGKIEVVPRVPVETPEDLPKDGFSPTDRVAITAGASTPQWLLEQVRARIESGAAPGGAKD